MILKQKYIRQIPDVVKGLGDQARVIPTLRNPERFFARVALAGFTTPLIPGETLVPDARLGSNARFNADGRVIKHKDRPKELRYYWREWTRLEWHGKEQVEVSDSVVISRYCYQRTEVPPPSMRLSVAVTDAGDELVVGPCVAVSDEISLINAINLVLSIAGECELVDEAGVAILQSPEIRREWEFFPAGNFPWEKVEPAVERYIARQKPSVRPLIWRRLRAIEKHNPSFRAVGRAGYAGYIVFGFESRGLYICESTRADNATYVFTEDWERFVRLTKAEVINGEFARERFVHLPGWFEQVERLFRNAQAA